jgi:hypothetical protein
MVAQGAQRKNENMKESEGMGEETTEDSNDEDGQLSARCIIKDAGIYCTTQFRSDDLSRLRSRGWSEATGMAPGTPASRASPTAEDAVVNRDERDCAPSGADRWLSRPCSASVVVMMDSRPPWLEKLSAAVSALRMLELFGVWPVLMLAIDAGRSWDA